MHNSMFKTIDKLWHVSYHTKAYINVKKSLTNLTFTVTCLLFINCNSNSGMIVIGIVYVKTTKKSVALSETRVIIKKI